MVVNDVHNNADALVVQGLNHLLYFVDSNVAVIRVGRERAFRRVVVLRVIAPVELRVAARLLNGAEIVERVEMHIVDAKLL